MKAICPVCKSARVSLLTEFTAESAANYFCPASRDPGRHGRLATVIAGLWGGDGCRLQLCDDCALCFAWPHVAGDSAFYDILHEQQGYPTQRWEYDVVASDPSVSAGGSVLDIGTGNGAFLKQLPANWRRHATESTVVARAALAAQGVDARAALEDFDAGFDGRFDLITLFQSIEHIAAPQALLRQVMRLLKPTGRLAISTPHSETQLARSRITGDFDVPPNHISIHSFRSMQILLQQEGFGVLSQQIEPASLKNFLYVWQLRTSASARANPWAPPGLATRIRDQKLRHAMLAVSGLWTLPVLLMHARNALNATSFLTIATKAR